MKKPMKKYATILLVIIFLLLVLIGVSQVDDLQAKHSNITHEELWIVTEKTVSDGMNYQAKLAVDMLQEKYPNTKIVLDILPVDTEQRAEYLANLRDQIEAGTGPDIFLLPTNEVLTLDEPQSYTYIQIDPLFSNVAIEMRRGTFADVNSMFSRDNSIDKQLLNTSIMEAGIVDKCQYVIPLRYDAPVIYVFEDMFGEYGIDNNIFSCGFDEWMQVVSQTQDPVLACGAEYTSIHVFSELIDYDSPEVILSSAKLCDYLLAFQTVQGLIGREVSHRTPANHIGYLSGTWEPFPVQIAELSHAIYYAAIAKSENRSLAMYPLRTVEGDPIAYVTYYAAIASYCKNPDLAYAYISILLSEEFQWGKERPLPATEQYPGLVDSSWPVLSYGSVAPLWDNLKTQMDIRYRTTDSELSEKLESRKQDILNTSLEDTDIPIIYEKYTSVVFPFMLSKRFDAILSELNDFSNNNIPSDVNIKELAEEVIEYLRVELQA